MSLLYSSNFKYPDGELRKHQELMDSSHYDSYQQQNQHNLGLARYRSAPSSFLESLVNGTGDQGGDSDGTVRIGCEDYSYFRSSSPEMDTMMARFMSPYNGTVDSNNHDLREYGERPAPAVKEVVEGSQMVYQSLSVHNLGNDSSVTAGNSLASTYSVVNSMDLETSVQETKTSASSGSNLPRQNSSPASFFSGLGVDNGFSMMRDVGSSRACDRFNGEASPSSTRLSNHINFSSAQRVLPRIAEIGDESISASDPGGNVGKRQYMPNFKNDSWSDNLNGLKRLKNEDGIMFSSLNNLDNQNGNSGNRLTGLTHHLSLPKTAAEMATVEKFLQFQGSAAPCKIRAKRGFATHPRSIAERVRRTRISERMRKLQELFPDMDKQTNTADMLDLAVEHIKNLQKQVKTLKDTKAKCMCSSKQKQCPSPPLA